MFAAADIIRQQCRVLQSQADKGKRNGLDLKFELLSAVVEFSNFG